MGQRTSYQPGVFCWVELNTPDVVEASDFYTSVLLTQAQAMPTSTGDYIVLQVEGDSAAGIYGTQNLPPGWLAYVSVDDVDASTKHAEQLGAKVLDAPRDVQGMGGMSIVADPTGAVFALWQNKGMPGATRVNDDGCFTMTQLNTSDPAAAQRFYSELFGWEVRVESEEAQYWGMYVDGRANAGMQPNPSPNVPDHWIVYFTSPDLEAASQRVLVAGGKVLLQPMQIPSGRIMVATDPAGAYFALFEGETDE